MQYDLIQGQGYEPLKVGNPSILKPIFLSIYSWSWQLTTDSETSANLVGPDF